MTTTMTTTGTMTTTTHVLMKSNSYCGVETINADAGILRSSQSTNLVIINSTDRDYTTGTATNQKFYNPAHAVGVTMAASNVNQDMNSTECDAFLLIPGAVTSATDAANRNSYSVRHSITRKMRGAYCLRIFSIITKNWYLSYLVPIFILFSLLFTAYLSRDYAKQLLFWIERQNSWLIFAIFMLLFTLVSFPIVFGYFVLLITAGYLFGYLMGWCMVILGANVGIAIAHWTMRSLKYRIPIQRLIKNETGRAILRVIAGPRAFKIVLFTRLTPIPFGVQNAIFGISAINGRTYHTATLLGLLPAQAINVYLGSTLRSIHEVLDNNDTKLTGYVSFATEVICSIILMIWVLKTARKELSDTLLKEGKQFNVQV